ncbi:Alpha/Beta hydrolase protein [Gigaspora rosea]|uniref:triacylglycerol lipase n=1 Tax=Gigaspora rosea TaxID=44941 RepID=A0A397VMT5_9GLOM|nr:Alpha/Beta hydrolase protein [Gigaspora rosea]
MFRGYPIFISTYLFLIVFRSFAYSQQIPFYLGVKSSNPNTEYFTLKSSNPNTKYFTLKQVLHHGGISSSTKNLFRKLEINPQNQQSIFTQFSFSASLGDNYHVVDCIDNPNPIDVQTIQNKIPNYNNKDSVLNLAKMSYYAYIELSKEAEWIDLDEDWEKLPFGWEDIGLRGYIFADPDNSTIIIAFKGTSLYLVNGGGPTAHKDKLNDNLMFSCCCAKIDFTWRGVCGCRMDKMKCNSTCINTESNVKDSYYNTALEIYKQAKIDYPNSNIWVTGHSLGGSIASLIALTYNLPAVVFQTPGELLYAKRIGLIPPYNSESELFDYLEGLQIYHFGHNADPVFIGTCNGRASTCYHGGFAMETKCHIGNTCTYDTRAKLGWKPSIWKHAMLPFMDEVINQWPKITNGKENLAKCEVERECHDCKGWSFV